jgi:hypothetical protein
MAAAQTPDGAGIGKSMKRTAEALKRYSYKWRTGIAAIRAMLEKATISLTCSRPARR